MWPQIFVIICASTSLVVCQFPISGPCPQVKPVENVTAESLSGLWFITASIPFFFQVNEKCGYFNFTQVSTDGLFSFEKHYVNSLTGNSSAYYGTLDLKANGQVELSYDVQENTYPFPFDIVELTSDTIILYRCNECGFFSDYGKGIYVIVLTKLQYPSCETTEAAMFFLANIGVHRDYVIMQDQNDCPNC